MTNWQVSESGATVALDDAGRGTVTVTVTNPGPDQDRAMLTVTAMDGAARDWFRIDEPQRVIAGGDSAVYVVNVEVPAGTAEGTYAFQPVAYSADRDPGETSSTGRRVVFDVRPTERPPFPWWLVAAVVALVAGIGGVAFILTRGDPPTNIEPPAVAGVPTVLEVLEASEGVWDGAEEFAFQWERCTADDDCEPIDGGVGAQYPLGNEDAGSRVRVAVTASNGDGSTRARSEVTDVVLPVPAVAFEVPAVVDLRRSQAVDLLSVNFRVQVLLLDELTESCNPPVRGQDPVGGTQLAQGETVTIAVRTSAGPCFGRRPFIEQRIDQAAERLAQVLGE